MAKTRGDIGWLAKVALIIQDNSIMLSVNRWALFGASGPNASIICIGDVASCLKKVFI